MQLNLCWNYITDSGATTISNALLINTSLTFINIGVNLITELGATSLSNSLIKNTSLKQLELEGNNIEDDVALKLIEQESHTNKDPSKVQKKERANIGLVPNENTTV